MFRELPGATVTLERVVPATDEVIPYFRVRDAKSEDVVAAFADHPGVRNIELVDAIDAEYLLRAEWVADHDGIITALAETGIPLIESVGTDEQWTLEVRGDSRADIAEFQRRCRDRDVPITLAALHALTPLETETEAALTDAQQEALMLAYRRGYFDSRGR